MACSGLQQSADHAGQGIEFGDGVDLVGGHAADHVVEQTQAIAGVGGGVGDLTQVHAQGLVDAGGRVGARGIGQRAIGLGQHQGVGVDDGLHSGRGGHIGAIHRGAGQCAVHSVQQHGVGGAVGQGQAGDTGGGVGRQVRRSACGAVGIGANGRQCTAVSRDARAHHGLQAAQAGDAAAVVSSGRNGLQHRCEVVGSDGADAQQGVELAGRESGRGGAARGDHQQSVDRIGQGVEVGDRVHISRIALTHQVIEQAQAAGVGGNAAQAHARGLVGQYRRICACSVCGAAIGLGQDGGIGIDDGLHFSGGVDQGAGDGGAGQGAVDGTQQRGVALQTGDACAGVDRLGRRGAGVAVGIADQGIEGSRLVGGGRVHNGLQIGQ